MRVLVISPYFPYPPASGVAMRTYQLVRQLADRHDVTLLSYANPGDRRGVEELSQRISVRPIWREAETRFSRRAGQVRSIASARPFATHAFRSHAMQSAIAELWAGKPFDVIQVEGGTTVVFEFPAGARLIVDEHNIEYELYRRLYEGERSLPRRLFNRLEYVRVRRFEQRCWERVDGCVLTSAREEPVVRAVAPATPTAVVPNGVDLDYFAPSGSPVDPDTVVFNGILDYRPNLDAAMYLVEEVWPLVVTRRSGARLILVGNAPEREAAALRRPGVEVAGRVADVRPYLSRAAVVAVPVRIGGGTRLKVVEALAMGKAMVSTPLGCEGIDAHDREHLLIADGPEAFAERILELFADASLRAELGAAGRSLAERSYSWDLAGDRLDALYRRVVGGPRAPRAIAASARDARRAA